MKPKLTFSIILLLLSALTFSLYADEPSVSGEIIIQMKRDVTNTQLSRSLSDLEIKSFPDSL